MNFKEYLTAAWSLHMTDPRKVADEIKQNFNLMESDDDVMAITRLIVHVCGEHLGDWTKGIELLRKLKNNATIKDQSEMNRYMAILNLGNNPNQSIENFSSSDQVIIYAAVASALASLGGIKTAEKFLNLADEISRSKLSKEDSAIRTLATTCNNIIRTLENKSETTANEIQLMILAAKTARHFWELVGIWKDVQKAEYRLSLTCLKAGLLDESLMHAQLCLDINSKNGNEPLELFFAYEALAMVEKAKENIGANTKAVEKMKMIYSGLNAEDKLKCKASLAKVS